jgi:3-deoxy-D-manno-octulosonic-acid transferase
MTAMYLIYSIGLGAWLLLASPYWMYQMLRHGKYRASLAARLGKVPEHIRHPGTAPVIWVHAVSVGEVLAIAELVEELRRSYPSTRVVLSTTTDTGQKLAKERFGGESVFYFPLDFAFAVRPYLAALRPTLVVVAETEFWPNFFRLAKADGARIAIVNARISDRSFNGYRRVRHWLRRVLAGVDIFLTQTSEDRRRLLEVGAPAGKLEVAGNLKFDAPVPSPSPLLERLRREFIRAGTFPVFVCGSTVEGEESLLLRAFEILLCGHPRAVMILAPRHPERFERVAALLKEIGLRSWRRSAWTESEHRVAGGVFLLDSIGELAPLYSLATIAFVGGSLTPRGGHNILEAARCGVPILVGPHTENFREMVNLFRDANALRVVGPAELPLALTDLAEDASAREEMKQRALQVMRAQAGATQRTVTALARLLDASLPAGMSQHPLADPALGGARKQ